MIESNKKANWFVRVLIIVLVIFIGVIIWISLINNSKPFEITSGIVLLISLIVIIVLSEVFDNFSLGKIISISREVNKLENKKLDLENKNSDLQNKIIQLFQTINMIQQTNISTNNNPVQITNNVGIKTASDEAVENKEKEEERVAKIEEENLETVSAVSKTTSLPYSILRQVNHVLEKKAINQFLERYQLNLVNLQEQVEFSESFKYFDPIMDRITVFDGYYNYGDGELFFEAIIDNFSPMAFDRLYVQLAKLYFYKQIKNNPVEMILFLIKTPKPSYRPYRPQRIGELFQPAILNKILRIETIEIEELEFQTLIDQFQ